MDFEHVWHAWPMFGPWQLRAGQHRANNMVQIVDTRDGGSFALRVYQHQRDIRRIRYEHALVTQLQAARLPFTVPRPVPTVGGDTMAQVATPEGTKFASLWPLAPGSAPRVGDLEQIHAAGQALGVLDHALAQVEVDPSPDLAPPARHGDLAHPHPLVADPIEAIAQLPVDVPSKVRVIKLLQRVLADVPHLYRTLPQQIIHRDYDGSNILMDGMRVAAVLDWEFSTRDLRALYLVVALHHWGAPRGSELAWESIDAVGRGYVRYGSLSVEERDALPALWRLRVAAMLIHRIGRHRQGLDTTESIVRRVAGTIDVDDWMQRNGTTLQQHARRW